MALTFNGTTIQAATFDGTALQQIYFNGTKVWESSFTLFDYTKGGFQNGVSMVMGYSHDPVWYGGGGNAPYVDGSSHYLILPYQNTMKANGGYLTGFDVTQYVGKKLYIEFAALDSNGSIITSGTNSLSITSSTHAITLGAVRDQQAQEVCEVFTYTHIPDSSKPYYASSYYTQDEGYTYFEAVTYLTYSASVASAYIKKMYIK